VDAKVNHIYSQRVYKEIEEQTSRIITGGGVGGGGGARLITCTKEREREKNIGRYIVKTIFYLQSVDPVVEQVVVFHEQ